MKDNLHDKIEEYLSGTLPPKDQQEFEEEMLRDNELAKEVKLTSLAYGAINMEGDKALKTILKDDVNQLWEKHSATKRKLNWQRYGLVAAAIITLLIATFFLLNEGNSTKNLQQTFASNYTLPSSPGTRANTIPTDSLTKADTLWQSAIIYYQTDRYQEAFEALKSYNNINADPEAFFYMGICKIMMDKPQEAPSFFKQVDEGSAERQRADWYTALAYMKAQDWGNLRTSLDYIMRQEGHYKKEKAQELLESLDFP